MEESIRRSVILVFRSSLFYGEACVRTIKDYLERRNKSNFQYSVMIGDDPTLLKEMINGVKNSTNDDVNIDITHVVIGNVKIEKRILEDNFLFLSNENIPFIFVYQFPGDNTSFSKEAMKSCVASIWQNDCSIDFLLKKDCFKKVG